jgi:hypothetical protein
MVLVLTVAQSLAVDKGSEAYSSLCTSFLLSRHRGLLSLPRHVLRELMYWAKLGPREAARFQGYWSHGHNDSKALKKGRAELA